jgi:hypothetical protein
MYRNNTQKNIFTNSIFDIIAHTKHAPPVSNCTVQEMIIIIIVVFVVDYYLV